MLNQYRYDISLSYMYEKKEVTFDCTQIDSVTIDYDYDNRNMPIMFVKMNIDKNVLDDMIKNSTTKTLTVIVSKYVHNSTPKILERYIRDRFIYFLPKNMNTQKDLDYSDKTKDNEDMFKQITIGLMKLELLDNNKRMFNSVFKDTTVTSMIVKNMTHMKLLMEPLDYTNTVERFIIPPINSVTNLIRYIDEYFTLYKTKYRLFYDYDKTYLISSSGNPIQSLEEHIMTVIINVNNTISSDSKLQGIEIDNKQKAYFIDVDSRDIEMFQNEATDKSYNTIVGIGSDGSYKKVKLKTENISLYTEKVKIIRIHNNNLDKVANMKRDIEDNSITVNVSKIELDTSVLTINKEYIIRNFDKIGYRNGKFLLSRKREIYTLDNDNFILSTILNFRKILS